MKGIVWLASYPKSGNTWFRVFLTNLLHGQDEPIDINQLVATALFTRDAFDRSLGWETSELPEAASDEYRAAVQVAVGEQEDAYVKIHEAFSDPTTGRPLVSREATRAAIYIIRNPLDVAVSSANFFGRDLESVVHFLNDRKSCLGTGSRKALSLRQPLGDWSWHVTSWIDAPELKVHVIRYEDMLNRPLPTFLQACRILGLPDDEARVAQAVKQSEFSELRKQEELKGFREVLSERRFFNRGRAGAWRQILTPDQSTAIIEAHQAVMRRFGYLRADGSVEF